MVFENLVWLGVNTGSRLAWSEEQIPGQPRVHGETLSQNTKTNHIHSQKNKPKPKNLNSVKN